VPERTNIKFFKSLNYNNMNRSFIALQLLYNNLSEAVAEMREKEKEVQPCSN
jgi:hypothetical protein